MLACRDQIWISMSLYISRSAMAQSNAVRAEP